MEPGSSVNPLALNTIFSRRAMASLTKWLRHTAILYAKNTKLAEPSPQFRVDQRARRRCSVAEPLLETLLDQAFSELSSDTAQVHVHS